jgi:MFS family permease
MPPPASLVAARRADFAVFVANGFGYGAWATAIPSLKTMLSLSAAQLSWALLAMSIGGVIAMQPASRIIQKLGGTGRASARLGYIYAAVVALPLLMPNLASLIAICVVVGGAICLMDVSMNAHASRLESDWGSAIMSSFHAGFSLGGLAGTGFGALMLMLHVPPHFLLLPVAGIVLAIVGLAAPHLGAGDVEQYAQGPIFRLPERSIALLAVVLTLCYMSEGAMADWSGIYLASLGETPTRAAAGYAAFSAVMVIGRLSGDAVVRRFGRSFVIGAGCVLAAFGLILATVLPYFPVVVIGFALVGAGLSNVVPCAFSTAAARASSPAAGIAEVSTAGFGGFLTGPVLIGAVAAAYGMRAGVGVIAAAATLAALFSLRLKTKA